ncbi:MAG: RagB/SusD family nutrient uptake outer membrane protein [Flavobacteriales bacterium]|nr:RagB/SusD family nutrient uptake outer membrane protein [Flavobacteriales bacterium]
MLIAMGLTTLSCEDYTDGINVDPNNFTSAPGNLILGQAELVAVKLSGSNSSRFSGMWVDQFTGSDRQYISAGNYLVTTGDFDDEWDDVYADGAAQARLAKAAGAESGDGLLEGVATIMEALLMGEAAALWGDIPYRTAFDYTENPDPTYDAQAQVLGDVQALLREALPKVGDASVAAVYGPPIFVANGAKWSEVIYSLSARYYMITKEYNLAHGAALQGISSAEGDLLSFHSSAAGARNLYYQFLVEQRGGYLTGNGSHLVKLMTGETPRAIATPGDAARFGSYFEPSPDGYDLNATDGIFTIDSSFPIVSWIETRMIEAEAAAQLSLDAEALAPFNAVRAYLATKYDADFPASTSTGTQLWMEIMEEKYVSMPGSIQIFHDVRRTNNALGVPIKGTGNTTIPQRFLYPQVEINANDNFPGLVDLFEPTPVNK